MINAMMSTESQLGNCGMGGEANVQPVFHPLGAILPSLKTKMISVRPAVTRKAPSQSTRLRSCQRTAAVNMCAKNIIPVGQVMRNIVVNG